MRVPIHIGIIPDGNRRWAVSNGMDRTVGYNYGLCPGVKIMHAAVRAGVEEITFYGFTMDNCKRPKEQVRAFTKACIEAVDIISKENCYILVVGNTASDCFPTELLKYTERTKVNNGGIKVNFLVNYSWKWDIQDNRAMNIHSKEISRIDMIMRWGGRRRLSGFLPVQSVYADIYVADEMWPEYQDEQFERALIWYQDQDVTLGG